eukprot:1056410-Amorphochlora_amoeboformis.AAC.1
MGSDMGSESRNPCAPKLGTHVFRHGFRQAFRRKKGKGKHWTKLTTAGTTGSNRASDFFGEK